MDDLAPREHNIPPSQIEFAGETAGFLSDWLKEHPVVETEEDAREAKLHEDRAFLCKKDAEDEQKREKLPYREKIKEIDNKYGPVLEQLTKLLTILKERSRDYLKRQEAERQRRIAEARKKAEEAEQAAREAEEREREAIDDARVGAESDIGAVIKNADEKFKQFQQAERALAYVEAEKVRLPSDLGRRTTTLGTLRQRELIVTDPMKALSIMGWSERLLEALGTDARLYKRKHGRFPDGVSERRL